MRLSPITVKFLGKKEIIYRAVDAKGEVVRVFETKAEAIEWIAANK